MRPVIPSIILGEVEYNLIGLELSIIIPTLIPKSQYPHIGWITLQLLNKFGNGHFISFSTIILLVIVKSTGKNQRNLLRPDSYNPHGCPLSGPDGNRPRKPS
jgi:hypothetical protein